jgi:hypothetical protein
MGSQMITAIVTILTAIIGVAIIAVLVSKNANTTAVISAGGNAFTGALGTALSPVTGQSSFAGLGTYSPGGGAPISSIGGL